ncbi:MAG: EAL domain-containing protein [Desulfobacteraceae bacterium]|nr:EAL domain-containing protein [Desulfobacteraceae bacterium]
MSEEDKRKILIVDDVPSNITVLTEILMTDYSIVCATNGKGAIKLAKSAKPNLILLDIMMPEMNGYEVCQQLKSSDQTKDILIIFLTAKNEEEDMVKGLELGAVDYISKPFSAVVLKHKLRIHIELKRHRENLEETIRKRTIEISKSHQELHQQMTERIQIQKKLIKQRAYFLHLFENSPQAIMIIESDGKVVEVNKGFEEIFGFNENEVKGKYDKNLIVSKEFVEENEQFLQNIMSGKIVSTETLRLHKNGSRIPVALLGYPAIVKGQVKGLFFLYKDISERKKFEERILYQAFHDSLTDIPNRSLLMERIKRSLERAKRKKDYQFAVVMIDLDNFKSINDSMGHQAGDQFLIQLSKKLKKCMRATDTVARMGGDEFAVLIEDFNTPKQVIQIVKRIVNASKTSFFSKGTEIKTSSSIGIVINARNYNTAEGILRDADIAMYRVKETGKSNYKIFKKRMHQKTMEALQLQNDLEHAINNNEFCLHYQPIVSLSNEEIVGFEALVRWQSPAKGIVYPDQFIPIAEETSLILPMGRFIINEAISQLKYWHRHIPGTQNLTMNVNISINQFMDESFTSFVINTLREYDLNPDNLNLEITENLLLKKTDYILSTLSTLREFGISVVMDDFGTGYSSLSYIQDFKIDSIKIDRSFIMGIDSDGGSAEIVETILSLCKNLCLGVVAEGVENKAQIDILQSINCEKAQGYYFSKPLNKNKATYFIKERFSQFDE